MSLNGVTSANAAYESSNVSNTSSTSKKKSVTSQNIVTETKEEAAQASSSSDAVAYKKSKLKNTTTVYDKATVEKMKAEAEEKTAQLRSLVEKMMTKQGKTYDDATDIYALLRSGNLEVDEETRLQAQEDIAEDGYWGVEKTSERLVSFAKALSGNNPEKADLLIDAVKSGFEKATKAWGDELPDICKKTLDATIEKLKKWKEELTGDTEDIEGTNIKEATK